MTETRTISEAFRAVGTALVALLETLLGTFFFGPEAESAYILRFGADGTERADGTPVVGSNRVEIARQAALDAAGEFDDSSDEDFAAWELLADDGLERY